MPKLDYGPRLGQVLIVPLVILACSRSTPAPAAPESGASAVTPLADSFVAAYFARYPEAATRRGLRDAAHGRVFDNSARALSEWQAREDAWLAGLRAIRPAPGPDSPEWTTYGIMRELLEAAAAQRLCRFELWNLSTSSTGWQAAYAGLAGIQPVGSDTLRAQALARLRALPPFLEREIQNLRRGQRAGYLAPRVIVAGVVRQLNEILASPTDSSPFASPAQRDSTPTFREAFLQSIRTELYPAIERYRTFLISEYLPRARETIGLSGSPDGAACYRASVRRYSTLDIRPEDVFQRGVRELERIEAELRSIAQARFGTTDLPALFQRLRSDTAFTFRSRQEIIDSSEAAIRRAKAAMRKWFGRLPRADVAIVPHPEFRQRAGAVAGYNAPAEDGSRPGIFYITTYRPEQYSRAAAEHTAFHEAIPGHHLQITLAQERQGAHPVTRFFGFSGFSEGWALYSERLADEMGLYSTDLGRVGLLQSEAFRAVRLVLDAGIHVGGWTRQQAVEYLTAHTALSPVLVQGEVDRYISWPGQATAYMLGNLEIRALRREAETRLGPGFDIREFHDRVLGSGSVTLPMLREQIEGWVESGEKGGEKRER